MNCGREFIDVITNDAETDVASVFFNDSLAQTQRDGTSSKGVLSLERHGVCFIEDDQFEGGTEYLACARECFDLFSHDVNTSVVTGIEFEDHLLVILSIDSARDGEDGGCLSCTGWSVEE